MGGIWSFVLSCDASLCVCVVCVCVCLCVCLCVCVCVLLQVLVTGPFAEVPLGWSCVECPVPPGTKGHPSAGGRWPAGTGGLHGRG